MKDLLVFDEHEPELNITAKCYLLACVDEFDDLVVTCHYLSNEQLAKLYFALFDTMNSRLGVDKFLSYLPEEESVKLLFNNENILFANK